MNQIDILKLKIARSKVKSSIDGLEKRLHILKKKNISELEDRTIETIKTDTQRKCFQTRSVPPCRGINKDWVSEESMGLELLKLELDT